MISRTALSGSSSRLSTCASTRRSSGSSATAASQMRFARLDATANTSRREVLAAALLEPPVALERRAMLFERAQQLGRRSRRASASVRRIAGRRLGLGERDDRAHLVQHRLRSRMIHLVDRDHVRDLHDPRLQRLHRVARAGHEHEQDRVRDPGHLDLALPRADGLDEDDVLPGGVEQEHRLQRRLGEPAEVAARPHRADVDAGVEEVVGEPDAVAEQRAARERARGIDRDDADRPLARADEPDERADQRSTCPTPGGPVTPTIAARPVSG